LRDDPDLEGSDVSVQSVNKGVVLLSGSAESLSDHLDAVSTAASVPGVRRVASEVKSPDAVADADIRRTATADAPAKADARGTVDTAAGEAKGAVKATTGAASDMWITSAVKLRLLADDNTPALAINVDTRDGAVTLFGAVPSEAAKKAAEEDARKVSGVKTIKNELQVVSEAKQEAVEAKDEEIQQAVETSINKRPELENVDVEVKNGVVRLSGTVPSENDRLAAAVAARSTAGVRAVLTDDVKMDGKERSS
jgi:hyperosmotically inducible protein